MHTAQIKLCILHNGPDSEVANSPRPTVYFENQNPYFHVHPNAAWQDLRLSGDGEFWEARLSCSPQGTWSSRHTHTHRTLWPGPFSVPGGWHNEQQLPQLLQNRLHFSSCLPYPQRPRQDLLSKLALGLGQPSIHTPGRESTSCVWYSSYTYIANSYHCTGVFRLFPILFSSFYFNKHPTDTFIQLLQVNDLSWMKAAALQLISQDLPVIHFSQLFFPQLFWSSRLSKLSPHLLVNHTQWTTENIMELPGWSLSTVRPFYSYPFLFLPFNQLLFLRAILLPQQLSHFLRTFWQQILLQHTWVTKKPFKRQIHRSRCASSFTAARFTQGCPHLREKGFTSNTFNLWSINSDLQH